MTQGQAETLRDALNQQLELSENTNLTYQIYATWNMTLEKQYNVILFPIEYKDKFLDANTSGQFAVARVSIKTQGAGAQTQETFIINFDNNVLEDTEANNLLNK
jgi:hypothetical protein